MKKIVVSTDWHGDWSSLGVSRIDEIEEAVDQSVQHAIAIKASAYLFAGDLADPDTGGGTFRAQELAIEAAIVLRAAGIPSVWLAGNHCVCEDGSGESVLSPMRALERLGLIYVADRPRTVWLEGVAIVCLPFVPASHGVDMAKAANDNWPADDFKGHTIVLSHLTIPGIAPGSETHDMPRGREVVYPLAETKDAFYRISGHYHQRQEFDPGDGGPPIHVVGSLARLGFGEQDNDPGFIVLDVPAP